MWVYAGLSAGINISHADAVGGLPAAVFYGVASLSATLVWERTLRAMRRAELRKLGAIDAPSPRCRRAPAGPAPGSRRVVVGDYDRGVSAPRDGTGTVMLGNTGCPPLAVVAPALVSGSGRHFYPTVALPRNRHLDG
ncbi:hypothetical protein GCM10023317_41080 [Actinopolymorpha pittospori]